MLVNGERALAYIVEVDEIKPIPNYDRVEHARVGGWLVIVRKNQFKVGDKALYIEVDAKVPENDKRFEFLEKRQYKVKTLRMCKTYSQGLLMPLSEFPELKSKKIHEDVTRLLGIRYSVEEDNVRKAKSDPNAKYSNMAARNRKFAKKPWFRWLMKRMWGRKLLFVFFGTKNDKNTQFPSWIKKTDEERIESCLWMLEDKNPYVVSEKIDGCSLTAFIDLTKRKSDLGVCSRNVRFPNCEDEDNMYVRAFIKYHMENALKKIANMYGAKRVVIQGELYGESIQGNKYKLDERRFAAFNLVIDGVRLGSLDAKKILATYNIPFVPIVNEHYILPDAEGFDAFKESADGKSVINNQCLREGFVYRSLDGQKSFKSISRKFLLKIKD